MPTSWPWRLSVVGSWVRQKTRSRSSKEILAGRTSLGSTSAWPVVPEQICFVGGVRRLAAAVAGDGGLHAAEVLEDGFGTPEAAGAEGDGFQVGVGGLDVMDGSRGRVFGFADCPTIGAMVPG